MTEPTGNAEASANAAIRSDQSPASSLGGFLAESGVADRLRAAVIPLTLQRLAVAQVMLAAPVHFTADEVLTRVRAIVPEISRATVYNALKLFSSKKLVREIIVDAERIVFDSNTTPHCHFYDVGTGELTDVPASEVKVVGLTDLPPGLQVETVDVVIRVRRSGV